MPKLNAETLAGTRVGQVARRIAHGPLPRIATEAAAVVASSVIARRATSTSYEQELDKQKTGHRKTLRDAVVVAREDGARRQREIDRSRDELAIMTIHHQNPVYAVRSFGYREEFHTVGDLMHSIGVLSFGDLRDVLNSILERTRNGTANGTVAQAETFRRAAVAAEYFPNAAQNRDDGRIDHSWLNRVQKAVRTQSEVFGSSPQRLPKSR